MGTSFFIIYLAFCSLLHPVHVSLLSIDLDPDTGKIEIAFKIFSDDFENIILQKYGVKLDIKNQVDPGDKIDIINNYIDNSFEMYINGTEIATWKYSHNEINEEAIWLFYESEWQGKIRSVSITNNILMDIYEDQTNLLIVTYGNKQNGYQLNNTKNNVSFDIN